jgi:hypothetical protein
MNTCKLLSAWAIGLCLLNQPAFAKAPAQKSSEAVVDADGGVIGSIDAVKGRMVISDRSYVFSPISLIVHESGRMSDVTALRAKQKVRFLVAPAKPGMPLTSGWTIMEIWIDEK